MEAIRNFLNKFTLYRLTLYCLIGILLFAFIFSLFGWITFGPLDVLFGTAIILLTGLFANYIFSNIFGARTNLESVCITLLILTLIFPIRLQGDIGFAMLAAVLAIASKYLLTVEKKHIFNPVAVSAVAMTFLYPDRGAIWWVGTPIMLPLVLLAGLLIIIKMKREGFVATFLISYLVITAIGTLLLHNGSWTQVMTGWRLSFSISALLFFAFVMLTEPLTSPLTKQKRFFFAVIVALLYSTTQLRVAGINFTPETALCFGNIFAYFVRPRKTIPQPVGNIQTQPPINGNIQPSQY